MLFPTTRWSQLAQASLNGDTASRNALEQWCRSYREPVRKIVLGRWPWPDEADDVTQDFFLHLMEKGVLKRADRERGRFRSFMLGSLRFFIAHRLETARAAKRGGGRPLEVLEDWMAAENASDPDFDRAWAIEVLKRAVGRLETGFEPPVFAVLRRFLPGTGSPPTYEEAALKLRRPVGSLKSDVSRLRQGLRDAIRREVALTVSAPHEIDEEMNHLHQLLRR